MAILDLLRRRRPDEEDEDADGTEDAVAESEDSAPVGGLLGRLALVPGVGRVLRRGDPGDDANDAGEDGEEAEDVGRVGSILGRLDIAGRIGGVLRRGGNEDNDEDEDDPPAVGIAANPEPPAQAVEPASSEGPEVQAVDIDSGEEDPAPEGVSDPTLLINLSSGPGEGVSNNGVNESASALENTEEERPQADRRLRELARSQEDIPAEELAGDLRELLNRINRRR